MNYQKLLSRFYNTNEQSTADVQQKCDGFINDSATAEVLVMKNDHDEEFDEEAEVSLYNEIDSAETSGHHWDSTHDHSPDVDTICAEKVRWFYKAIEDKLWCEFNGYDSLLIENKYRETKCLQELDKGDDVVQLDKVVLEENGSFVNVHTTIQVKNETKEDSESLIKKYKNETNKKNIHNEDKLDPNNDNSETKSNAIPVRGGMYEVNIENMTCQSIYWPGEQYLITRGLYFYDGSWQPLEGSYGEILEEEHLRLFDRKNVDRPEKFPLPSGVALHSYHFNDFHVEWLSSSEIYLYWGGAPRQLVRSVTQKLGFYQSTGYRLKRGYRKIANVSERPPEITHVVFVIHGIGQKMDSGRIIRNTNALRTSCDWLRSQYPNCGGSENKGRAELFPARWRAGERGDAAELLAAASPLGAPALRRAINDAAMDVMYYTSPVYGKQVQDDLTNELNRLYTMFMNRNPNFKGSFSAVAHSLGCVIIYDVITGFQMGCERCTIDEVSHVNNNGLLFQLQNLFCLGSPLGVFLSLRQPKPGLPRILPPGFNTRLYNIFHLSDPVAYRLEPLFACWLSKHSPLVIPSHYTAPMTSPSSQASPAKGPWKIWSYVKHPWQRSETNSPVMVSNSTNSDCNESPLKVKESLSRKSSLVTNIESHPGTCEKSYVEQRDLNRYENEPNFEECEPSLDETFKEKHVELATDDTTEERNPEEVLPYRIDYTLRDSFITNNYISAITSHTSYWNNYDVAYFILSLLFEDVNNEDEIVNTIDDSI